VLMRFLAGKVIFLERRRTDLRESFDDVDHRGNLCIGTVVLIVLEVVKTCFVEHALGLCLRSWASAEPSLGKEGPFLLFWGVDVFGCALETLWLLASACRLTQRMEVCS